MPMLWAVGKPEAIQKRTSRRLAGLTLEPLRERPVHALLEL
jgi:hypothetical protein